MYCIPYITYLHAQAVEAQYNHNKQTSYFHDMLIVTCDHMSSSHIVHPLPLCIQLTVYCSPISPASSVPLPGLQDRVPVSSPARQQRTTASSSYTVPTTTTKTLQGEVVRLIHTNVLVHVSIAQLGRDVYRHTDAHTCTHTDAHTCTRTTHTHTCVPERA